MIRVRRSNAKHSETRAAGVKRGDGAQGTGAESPEQLFDDLRSSRGGLTSQEATQRLIRYGRNALPEREVSALRRLLSYFWGPIPWMIEVAAVLSAVLRHWDDLVVILVLLGLNAAVGFWQERTAADAVAALKRQLALRASVRRDGRWVELDASELVPGDLIRVRLGDIVPADVTLLDGDYLRIDQSSLTGESLPVDRQRGEVAYSGSVAVQSEMTAIITQTGAETYFGRTTLLVESAKPVSHFQKAVLSIGKYLIWLSISLVTLLVAVELLRGAKALTLIQFALILTVTAIPVAMPAVLSVTMAVGAISLSRMKAIVTRLESIEEMAGIDVLCSDKTGTLTENRLLLGEPVTISAADPEEVVLAGALASQREGGDAIDEAVIAGVADESALDRYETWKLVPFDPVSKRATAELIHDGKALTVTKGAPQVVIDLCELGGEGESGATGESGAIGAAAAARIEAMDGFAEVFPEHKYRIVKALQGRGHLVGMTGDGVNDAPALKQADTGIAVSGATDAARAAADLVLTAPGLSVIVEAIEEARRIFERMDSYAVYRVTETIRIVLFVVAAMIVFDFYPITAILIILLALFNDLPIMTIAVDNTRCRPWARHADQLAADRVRLGVLHRLGVRGGLGEAPRIPADGRARRGGHWRLVRTREIASASE